MKIKYCNVINKVVFISFIICYPAIHSETVGNPFQTADSPTTQTPKTHRAVEHITVGENIAFTGLTDELIILSVTGGSDPVELTRFSIDGGHIEDFALNGNTALVAAGGAGLCVLDMSNSAQPQMIRQIPTPGYAEAVTVKRDLAYVADGGAGIRIIDVSDPASAGDIGFACVTGYAFDIQVGGNHAYIAGGGGGLLVVDVSDPSYPREVGTCNTPGYTYGLDVIGGTAYLADGWEGFRIVDVSNPHHPVEIGAYRTPGWSFDVKVRNGKAYVADAFAGIRILDVTDPHRPEEIAAFEDDADIHSLSVKDGIIFAADRSHGVRVIDISDIQKPISSGLCRLGDISSTGGFERRQRTRALQRNPLQPRSRRTFIPPRKPESAETFSFSPIGQCGGQIKAVDVEGNHAYIGVGLRIEVLDITDRTTPSVIGTSSILRGFVTDVQKESDRLYATLDKGGLSIIDISDPTQPDEVGYIDLPGYPEHVDISGDYACIASGGAGLRVVDVSDPERPEEVGFVYTDGYAHDVVVKDGKAFVAGAGSGLRIVDVSDPENPYEISGYDTPGFARSLTLRDNTVLMTDGDYGLRVIDVSDPEQPLEIEHYALPEFALYIRSEGTTAYVTTRAGLSVLDITDPAGILSLGTFEESGFSAVDVSISQHTAFIADGWQRLRLIDITDMSSPYQIGGYETMGYAASVETLDDYAFIASGSAFNVIDISDLTRPKRVFSYPTGPASMDLALFDSYIYMHTIGDGHFIFDISTPDEPVFVSSVEFGDGYSPYIVFYEGKIYYANEAGLNIFDVSDPSNPYLTGYIFLSEGGPGHHETNAVDVSGNLAYVTLGGWGLKIVDVSDPDHLSVVGVFEDTEEYRDLVVVGDRAYVCCRQLKVLDVSDPAHPTELGICYDMPSAPNGITVSGEIAYLSVGKNGFVAVDVSDPSDMTIVGEYDTPGSGHNTTLRDSLVFCADGEAGLLILKKLDAGSQKPENASHSTDQLIVRNNGNHGEGSFRECVYRALPGQTITFDTQVFSPSHPDTISLSSASLLPITRDRITIDASDAGVILDGHQLTEGSGLKILSDHNQIKGLQILYFPEHGIDILGNDNTIGGDRSAGEGNVLSGNGGNGILVSGKRNSILGNFCGTDDQGTSLITNVLSGVELAGDSNRVGGYGPSVGERNVLSGNMNGVAIFSDHNIVVNNLAGTDVTGTRLLGNESIGIWLEGSYNTVGGDLAWERNLISGNGVDGIRNEGSHNSFIGNYIGTDITGSTAIGNHHRGYGTERQPCNVLIKNNLISGNLANGMVIYGSYNQMTGNIMGLDASGVTPLSNVSAVLLFSSFNRLGGSLEGEQNIISGNEYGIGIQGTDQIVIGNNIGTDASGKFLIGNGRTAIDCGGVHNFVGGATAEEGNTICGEDIGLNFTGSPYYFVAGNSIGCDPVTSAGIGDLRVGIYLLNGSDNYIGPGNRIMYSEEGVRVIGHYSEGNTISRNRITQNDKGIYLLQGGNREIASPSITHFTTSSVSGTTVPNSLVEIFSDPEDEGMLYEGTTRSDSLGNFTFTIAKGLAGPNVTATVTDMGGNTSEFSGEVQGVNDRPSIDQTFDDVTVAEDFGNRLITPDLHACFSDAPPETTLTYSASSLDPLTLPAIRNDSLFVHSVCNAWGTDRVIVTATDIPGLSISDTFEVTISPVNDAPEFAGLPDTVSFSNDDSETISIWDCITDPETHDSLLVYGFDPGSDSLLTDYDSGTGILTLSAHHGFSGQSDLYISVTDDSGAVAEDSMLVIVTLPSGLPHSAELMPKDFKLYQNYPNPFNPETKIRFEVPVQARTAIHVYNIGGQCIRTLVDEIRQPGCHEIIWDAKDDRGDTVSSGVYFIRFESKQIVQVKKVVLLR